jgi:hypothetical protein
MMLLPLPRRPIRRSDRACRPFSQVNTISEQLPMGPELTSPKSAAAACRRLMLTANPMKMAAAKNRPSALRIDAPKLKSLC